MATVIEKLEQARTLIDEALTELSVPGEVVLVPDPAPDPDPVPEPVPTPASYLTMPPDFSAAKYLITPLIKGVGKLYTTDFNIAAEKPVRAALYYVDPVNGLDTNAGTISSPLKSVKTAMAKTGDNEIVCAAGVYPRIYGPNGYNPSKGISIVCNTGTAVFSNDALKRVWTEHASYPGLYMAPCSVADDSWADKGSSLRFYLNHDPLNFDSLGELIPAKSTSQLIAGAIGVSVGTTSTAIRLVDNAAPSYETGFCVKWAADNIVIGVSSGQTCYLENIAAIHGSGESARFASAGTGKFVSVGCKFIAGISGNAASWVGGSQIINWQCQANLSALDGFNYHAHSSYNGAASVFENLCSGHTNGTTSSGANNGSTVHEQYRIVRLNCKYHNNQDRNIHDIGSGASMNIGCTSNASQTAGTESIAFGHPTSDDSVQGYVIGCDTDYIRAYSGSSAAIDAATSYLTVTGTNSVFTPS